MAIYHLSVKTVSRAKGRSATAAAAYRAGVEIADERSGEVHDYTRKIGVAHTEILLPDGADPKFEDRSVLWNEAEKSENRKNSTVAREYEVALPAEFSDEERKALATEFGAWLTERFGVGVDVCIHEPNKEGDQRNHHAHILTTTRKIEGGELISKTRELDDRKTGAIEEVRTVWEDLSNRHLERSQEYDRIDRRSFERQGKEKAPSVHLGPSATAMERRGEQSERGNLNRIVSGINNQFEAARTYLEDIAGLVRDQIRVRLGSATQEHVKLRQAPPLLSPVEVADRLERRRKPEKSPSKQAAKLAVTTEDQKRLDRREKFREVAASTGDLDKLWRERKLKREAEQKLKIELEKRREKRQQKEIEQQRSKGGGRSLGMEL